MTVQSHRPVNLLGRYTLESEIGRGGMGVVYKALDQERMKTVAIKALQLQPDQLHSSDTLARFEREARMSLTLKHPNIVEMFDFVQAHGQPYLIMEYLEGASLKDFLSGKAKLNGLELMDCLIQFCDGLHYAHQQGVVHRDIKPDNLFITRDGEAKIMDFGIARQNTAEHFLLKTTQPGTMMGTLNYMSPEQLQDSAQVDQRADVFSMGVVMYELFTGQLPFDGESMGQTILHILQQEAVPPQTHNPRIPDALNSVILKALLKRRGQRFQNTLEIARELLKLRGEKTEHKKSDPTRQDDTGKSWKRQTQINAPQRDEGSKTSPGLGSFQDRLADEGLSMGDEHPQKYQERQWGLELECLANGMEAWLSFDPTYATQSAQREDIAKLLHKAGISYGQKDEVIERALKQGFLERTLIAQGSPAQEGKDAQLEYLIGKRQRGPEQRDDGSVDHRELGLHQSVKAGTPLMRKHEAEEGQPGTNVFGRPVMPKEVQDLRLLEGPGTALASEDSHLLIATRDGMPVKMCQSVRVETVLKLEEVGLSSGHIRFDGSVIVNGNVSKGFHVEAGGDLVVHGTVEDTELSAGGNLYIYGPVYGGANTCLRSRYNFKGQFIQNAEIICGGDLEVSEALMNCKTQVKGQAKIASEKGRGLVSGGQLYSTYFIQVKQAGANNSNPTTLAIGSHPRLENELVDLESQLNVVKQKLQANIKNMIYLRTQGDKPEVMKQLEKDRGELLFESNTLSDELNFLKNSLKQADEITSCRIRINGSLHAGVKVNLSGHGRQFDTEHSGPLTLFAGKREGMKREVVISYG